jgi:acyl-coenzyme A synthetase/AMP-(fatty) acid ligase
LGYRIELGEIEKALCALYDVCDAAVIPIAAAAEDETEIIAFVESSNGFTAHSILKDLRLTLPHYMVPHSVQMVEKLPRTENQKIDRQRLKVEYLQSMEDKKNVRSPLTVVK